MTSDRPEVLFLCVHNAGRSQMAAAILTERAGDRVIVHSAGSAPGEKINPAVVAAMAELGIDISAQVPKKLTDQMVEDADIVVLMGCGDACPVYPGKRYVEWVLPDPAGKTLDEVRAIRDQIEAHVEAMIAELVS